MGEYGVSGYCSMGESRAGARTQTSSESGHALMDGAIVDTYVAVVSASCSDEIYGIWGEVFIVEQLGAVPSRCPLKITNRISSQLQKMLSMSEALTTSKICCDRAGATASVA